MSTTNSPLYLAVQNGNIEIVKMLLAAGHSPNEVNAEGLSPLGLAVTTNNLEIVQLLTAHIEANNQGIPPTEPERQNLSNNSRQMISDKNSPVTFREEGIREENKKEQQSSGISFWEALAVAVAIFILLPFLRSDYGRQFLSWFFSLFN